MRASAQPSSGTGTEHELHLIKKRKKKPLTRFSGDAFRGQWHYNEMQQHWEGNPVQLGEINDLMKAIKHKIKADRKWSTWT